MATPPDGHYGPQQQQVPLKRYNFPSAPSTQRQPAADPERAPEQGGYPPQQHGYEASPPPYQGPAATPAPPMPPAAPPAPAAERPAGGPGARPVGGDQQHLVRPYAMTGGRTRPRYQLAVEALVSTIVGPDLRTQLPEHQRICQLCREVKSVAEVSALLSLPLGVARILVADLAEAGFVAIHQPGGDEAAGGQPDVTLLERVLSGLRKL